MVSQLAMATTVRKVKQENRMRRQNQNQGRDDLHLLGNQTILRDIINC